MILRTGDEISSHPFRNYIEEARILIDASNGVPFNFMFKEVNKCAIAMAIWKHDLE